MLRLLICIHSLVLPANDWYYISLYCSLVGIARVCMIVFGYIFYFIFLLCTGD